MISKELLIAAGGCNPNVEFYLDDNYIVIGYDGENHYDINIYELAHKCKEWAISLGYSIFTGYICNEDDGTWCKCDVDFFTHEEAKYCTHLYNDTNENEAIFKACQWILDNKSIP